MAKSRIWTPTYFELLSTNQPLHMQQEVFLLLNDLHPFANLLYF